MAGEFFFLLVDYDFLDDVNRPVDIVDAGRYFEGRGGKTCLLFLEHIIAKKYFI